MLEEEIARLEEQVVHFRQDLYQEAVYLQSSKMKMDHSARLNNASPNNSPRLGKLNSPSQTMGDAATSASRSTVTVPGE